MARQSITLNDIYEVVNRLEDKMEKRFTPLEEKVDSLEDFRSKAVAIYGLVSLAASAIFSWVWSRLTKGI